VQTPLLQVSQTSTRLTEPLEKRSQPSTQCSVSTVAHDSSPSSTPQDTPLWISRYAKPRVTSSQAPNAAAPLLANANNEPREVPLQARSEDGPLRAVSAVTPATQYDTFSTAASLPVLHPQHGKNTGTRKRDIAAARLKHFEQMAGASSTPTIVVASQTSRSPMIQTKKQTEVIDLTLD